MIAKVARPRALVFESHGEADTARFAQALAQVLGPGDVVALRGPLGAGKTTLVRALSRALEVPREAGVSSPSFALVNIYDGGILPIAHVDLYRISGSDDLEALGFRDLCDGETLVFVEWPEKAPEVLELATIDIRLEDLGPSERRIRTTSPDPEIVRSLARELRSSPPSPPAI